jgi:hypothetical protein
MKQLKSNCSLIFFLRMKETMGIRCCWINKWMIEIESFLNFVLKKWKKNVN